ncbi:DUF222 domain-containing protein [Nocardioides sp.]|uniref:HNH endonuclease signature motif containing protein n=1 Tax=Nocardioides sp. TaxID=35761 RepID=UPI003566475E
MSVQPSQTHPVSECVDAVVSALKDVADLDPVFMATGEKEAALLGLVRAEAALKELHLRVLASAQDVAVEHGQRDVAAWLAHAARVDRGGARRDLRLAQTLESEQPVLRTGLREGTVNLEQARVIASAVRSLPDHVEPAVRRAAETRLVDEAAAFGPKALRLMGRRVLDIVAPEVGESAEAAALAREDVKAEATTFLRTRSNGDGTTDIHARVSDLAATRLLTYLHTFTNPRREAEAPVDRRPYDHKLGAAFEAFLETIDPRRLPIHGGDATTVMVTIDHATLLAGLDAAGVAMVGDEPISAAQARRLACNAKIIPVVLGGASEVLDLGRSRRLFSAAQRKAMAIRSKTCDAEGCDMPAHWCEAHHASGRWVDGGKTDLADGMLLCSHHHHRAHDYRYQTQLTPNGELRFNRRR